MDRTEEQVADELRVLDSQAGDPAALRALVECWQPRLLHYVTRLTGDPAGAQDVTQEAWLGIGLIKIWYWMELNRNTVLREIKRLELQVAHLAGRVGK